jgi:acid phosphatase (class A)
MKRFLCLAFLLVGAAPALLIAADAHFVKPVDFDAVALLAPPPVAGSDEAKMEVETILKLQQRRTPEEVARAKSEAKLSPAAFASVLGSEFTADNCPKIFALLTDAAADSKILSDGVKTQYDRKRPKFVDSRVTPAIDGENDASYPSGHATRGMLWSRILIDIAPDKKDALIARGEEIGWDRVLAGVHYPSDVYAGRVLGQNLAQVLKKSPDFQSRIAEAKAEYAAFHAAHVTAAREPVVAH